MIRDHEQRSYERSKMMSSWRQDLIEISDAVPMTDTEFEKEVKEKKHQE